LSITTVTVAVTGNLLPPLWQDLIVTQQTPQARRRRQKIGSNVVHYPTTTTTTVENATSARA